MPKLLRKLTSLEGVIPALHEYYVKNEAGEFVLDAEGTTEDADIIKTIRQENAQHRTKNRDLAAAWQGLEAPKVREALIELEALKAENEARDSKDDKKFNAAVEARVKVLKAPLEAQVAELTTAKSKLEGQVVEFERIKKQGTIREAMVKACQAVKCDPDSYTGEDADAILWAERYAEIGEDGTVVDKKSGLGLEAALKAMQTSGTRKTWWPPSEGTGSRGSSPNGPSGTNPYAAESWNMSQQLKLAAEDPKLAEVLASKAGVKVGDPFHPKNGPPAFQY